MNKYVNKNVNVHVYSPDIYVGSADCTPLVLKHTLLHSHLLWGEFSIWAFCCRCSQSLHFSLNLSFHQVPITAGWT